MMMQTDEMFPEAMWVTAVQVATVWTNPEAARTIDAPGTANPTDIVKWIAGLTYETNLALCDENRIQTQLLYGEPVLITEMKGEWAHVVIPSQPSSKDKRGYPGWVPLNQLKKVNKSEWITDKVLAVTSNQAWLENEAGVRQMELSFMSCLPVETIMTERVLVKTPQGNGYLSRNQVTIFPRESGIKHGSGPAIVQAASRFIGLAYFWGGMSAFGYDCSGLAYAAYKANGYTIARDAGDQAAMGKPIPFDQQLPGDLLFFAYEEGRGALHHVGICTGKGEMIHAPQTGKGVERITIQGTIYEKELCAIRRYVAGTKETDE
jgi:cell wall-associated NlpC family hydrolase